MALGDACVKEKGSQREKWMAIFNQWREQNNEAKGKNQPVPQSLFAQLAEIERREEIEMSSGQTLHACTVNPGASTAMADDHTQHTTPHTSIA